MQIHSPLLHGRLQWSIRRPHHLQTPTRTRVLCRRRWWELRQRLAVDIGWRWRVAKSSTMGAHGMDLPMRKGTRCLVESSVSPVLEMDTSSLTQMATCTTTAVRSVVRQHPTDMRRRNECGRASRVRPPSKEEM
jgi:hypothetical protein